MRDNGAVEGAAAGFAVGDQVIVMRRNDDLKIYVVGHVDGIKACIKWLNLWIVPTPIIKATPGSDWVNGVINDLGASGIAWYMNNPWPYFVAIKNNAVIQFKETITTNRMFGEVIPFEPVPHSVRTVGNATIPSLELDANIDEWTIYSTSSIPPAWTIVVVNSVTCTGSLRYAFSDGTEEIRYPELTLGITNLVSFRCGIKLKINRIFEGKPLDASLTLAVALGTITVTGFAALSDEDGNLIDSVTAWTLTPNFIGSLGGGFHVG